MRSIESSKQITTDKCQDEPDLSLQHLQAELARIDLFIQREVWRWQLTGQNPTDIYRGLYLSDADAEALLAHPLGTSWGQMVPLEPSEMEALAEAEARAAHQIQSLVETARRQGQSLRLVHLADAFGLSAFGTGPGDRTLLVRFVRAEPSPDGKSRLSSGTRIRTWMPRFKVSRPTIRRPPTGRDARIRAERESGVPRTSARPPTVSSGQESRRAWARISGEESSSQSSFRSRRSRREPVR